MLIIKRTSTNLLAPLRTLQIFENRNSIAAICTELFFQSNVFYMAYDIFDRFFGEGAIVITVFLFPSLFPDDSFQHCFHIIIFILPHYHLSTASSHH